MSVVGGGMPLVQDCSRGKCGKCLVFSNDIFEKRVTIINVARIVLEIITE